MGKTFQNALHFPPPHPLPFQDIFKHCTDEGITSVTEIPYFEGDFWPNVVEETIKELDQEAKQREASEKDTDVSGYGYRPSSFLISSVTFPHPPSWVECGHIMYLCQSNVQTFVLILLFVSRSFVLILLYVCSQELCVNIVVFVSRSFMLILLYVCSQEFLC